ncbi:MAG TPA: PEP-utilizing enzyme [Candidatus Limnocylindria bacterium]|jgi:pyruvate,water dikinase|nr:PEP-utilizing enzyme [Candidatus Limnocylindria bacterium]
MSDPEPRQPLLPPGPEGFRFEWAEPGDADISWEWDDMHMPEPLSPLGGDYCQLIAQGFAYRFERIGVPVQVLARVWHGYAYYGVSAPLPKAELDALWERMPELRRNEIPATAGYWNERAIPELRAAYAELDAIDAAAMAPEDLAVAWDESWARIGRAWRIHFYAITGVYQVLDDLAAQYEALVADASPGEALRLIGGTVSEVQDVAEGLERLVDLARDDPAVSAWLRAGADAPQPIGHAFAEMLGDFLRRHGHLGQSWDDLQIASWAEEPHKLLRDVAKRLDAPGERVADRQRRLAEDAEQLLGRVRQSADDRPEELAAFERTLAAAREIGHISETHNYWIDRMAQATLRRLVMRVAARLVESGALADPADVFYLRRDEIRDLILAPRDRRELVAARRAEHAQQRQLTPLPWVGQPPDEGGGNRFDTPERQEQPGEEVRGAGASAGIARGPARVARGQADFDRIQPGDVIVCPSSNPSWVPLFSIAAALVTDTGGVLSHAAVVARELGLPAVVGTRDATHRIADGRLVEVDGAAGIVRLL